MFDLVVLTEALTKISPENRARSSRVPWRLIADTRNRLVHVYWRHDRRFVEYLIEAQLPDLRDALDELAAIVDGP